MIYPLLKFANNFQAWRLLYSFKFQYPQEHGYWTTLLDLNLGVVLRQSRVKFKIMTSRLLTFEYIPGFQCFLANLTAFCNTLCAVKQVQITIQLFHSVKVFSLLDHFLLFSFILPFLMSLLSKNNPFYIILIQVTSTVWWHERTSRSSPWSYKWDSYNSTKDSMLNTQTCLRGPHIKTSEGGHNLSKQWRGFGMRGKDRDRSSLQCGAQCGPSVCNISEG